MTLKSYFQDVIESLASFDFREMEESSDIIYFNDAAYLAFTKISRLIDDSAPADLNKQVLGPSYILWHNEKFAIVLRKYSSRSQVVLVESSSSRWHMWVDNLIEEQTTRASKSTTRSSLKNRIIATLKEAGFTASEISKITVRH